MGPARSAPPPPQAPGAGGGLTSPRGITAARPPFSFCNLWRGLWDSSISAMLAVLNVLGQLLGPSQGVLLPLGAVLGASWSLLGPLGPLLGGSWGFLGASEADLEAIPNNKKIRCKTRQILDPETPHTVTTLGGGLGSQNRPKSIPKRVKI